MTCQRRAVAALLLLLAAPAIAEPASDERDARVLFDQGVRAADGGRYAEAVTSFERSHKLRPSPVVLHNLALAYRGVGRLLDAIDAFERYLANPSARATPQSLAEIQSQLAAVRREVPEVALELRPAAARVLVDGREIPSLTAPLRMNPGRHAVEVRAEDHVPQRFELDLKRGERHTLTAQLVETPADATIVVETDVPAATVELDGALLGQHRATVAAQPGDHRVVVSAPGYRRVQRALVVGRHGAVRVDVVLQRQSAALTWGLGIGIPGGLVIGAAVITGVVLGTRRGDPAPEVSEPFYWGQIPFPEQ
ncbi:MAG: PEGA domain-containing protein [Myxococcales bacterium]|nr:PEGA domain-containing protein [Myxococcales bacterium]